MKKSVVSAVCLALISLSSAKADVITNWEFSVTSGFVSWLSVDGNWKDADTHQNRISDKVAGDSVYDTYGINTVLEWSSYNSNANNSSGVAGIRSSSLELHSQEGTITTDGVEATALTMIHNNQTIGTNAPKPQIMDISVSVLLTGYHSDGSMVSQELDLVLRLGFIETSNQGFGMKYTEDDIFFVIDSGSTTKKFWDNEGNLYDASLDAVFQELTGLHLLETESYLASNPGLFDYESGQTLYGWSTLENTYQANTMDVNIVVRHADVPGTPEPSTMLIVGFAGLAGLAAYRKKRRGC